MIINKITREYSKSINTQTYGGPESWVKMAAVYEAQLESADDPKLVSDHLEKLAMEDVLAQTKAVIEKIKAGVAAKNNPAPSNSTAGTMTAAPRTL